jgi:hypothetical protein
MTKQLGLVLAVLGAACNGGPGSVDAGAEIGGTAGQSGVGGHSGIGGSSGVQAGGATSPGGTGSFGGYLTVGGHSGTFSWTTTHSPYDAGFVLGVTTPGVSACGNSTCPALPHPQQNTETESYCCVLGPSTGDAYRQTCYRNANLGACESGVPIYCDDAADCNAGLVCCISEGRFLLRCQADCGTRTQLCKTDAECRNGKKCSGTVDIDGWVDGQCQ